MHCTGVGGENELVNEQYDDDHGEDNLLLNQNPNNENIHAAMEDDSGNVLQRV